MKKTFLNVMFSLMILVFSIHVVYAAPVEDARWEVPLLGVMKGPVGFAAIDFEQWLKQMEPALTAATEQKPGATVVPPKFDKIQFPPELKMYQLQVDSGNAYHIAWAVVYKDNKTPMPIDAYFVPGQQDFLDKINGMLQVGIKAIETPIEKTGILKVKFLNVTPAAPVAGSSEVIYSLGGRLIVDSKGMVIPLSIKAYFLNREGKLVSVLIVAPDSDGEFWRDTADQLFVSIVH